MLEFHSTKANEPLLQAVEIIRGMNESGKRKVPDDSPVDFISKRWKKRLYENDGTTINRHYYEMAVLTELREHVRAGDVSIVGADNIEILRNICFPNLHGIKRKRIRDYQLVYHSKII